MNSVKVSVIVPVYNVSRYLENCVNSITDQDFTDFEIILVDDCSPDNSGEICDRLAKEDGRIRVIHKEKNGGLGEALRAEYPGLLVFAAQGAAPSAHSLEGLRRQCGQDAETVTRRILEALQ